MRCEDARETLSQRLDEPITTDLGSPLDEHVSSCAGCAAFEHRIRSVRRALRLEPLGTVPPIADAVMRTLPPGREKHPAPTPGGARRGRWLGVAAAFVAGALTGSLLVVATDRDGNVAVADIAHRVVSAQRDVRRVEAVLEIVERGWHPDVPERRFAGRLAYEAPDQLSLSLEDRTSYRSPAWAANDVTLVVDGTTRWTSGIRDCPAGSQPQCTPRQPRVHVVRGTEPFDAAWPLPLELVTPVGAFLPSSEGAFLGRTRIAQRPALGLRATAATVADLLDAIRPAGNLRVVHPADVAELWLDEETMVPLRLRIVAAASPDRDRWAAALGYSDAAGATLLDLRVTALRLGEDAAPTFPPPPPDAVVDVAGFTPTAWPPPGAPLPSYVPDRFRRHVAGVVSTGEGPDVAVLTWTDGRAWLKVRSTDGWQGGRLFGDVGRLVRGVELDARSIAYVSEDGRAVALHGDGVDVVVTGSLPPQSLLAVARSLPIRGVPVPGTWDEGATADLGDAARALTGLLVPAGSEAFAPPAVEVDGDRVVLAYSGPGARGFLVVETPGRRLSPPLDPRATAVAVRGGSGRWNPDRAEVEWVEAGVVVSITSRTLALPELLAVAEGMVQQSGVAQ